MTTCVSACLFLLSFGFSTSVSAATFTWLGTLGTDWNNALNWNNALAGYPNSADDVVIIQGGLLGNPILDANRTIASLTINSGSLNLGGFTLTVSNGSGTGNVTTSGGTLSNGILIGTGATANIQNLTASAQVTLNHASFTAITSNTFSNTVVINKTGSAVNNVTNSDNTFSGATTITHNGGAAGFRFLNNTFSALTINSLGTGAFEFSYSGASTYNGTITINTSTTGVSFGAGGGTSAMSAGAAVNTGTYTAGNSSFTAFTQSGTAANSLTLSAGNITFTNCDFGGSMSLTASAAASVSTFTNTAVRGTFSMNTGAMVLSNSNFNQSSGSTAITKSGTTIDDVNNNGNTFWGSATNISHNGGNRTIRFSSTTGNTFHGNLTINNNSSGLMQFAHTANDIYNGNITINTSTTGVSFGANGGSSTQAATRAVNTGTYSGGSSTFDRFTQNGSAASALTLTGGNVTITNSTFGGNMVVTAPASQTCTFTNSVFSLLFTVVSGGVAVNNCTFNQNGATTSITTTGSSIDSPNNGGNTFYGITSITNNTGAARTLYFANITGDTFYANAVFNNGGSGLLSPVRNGISRFYGNITVTGAAGNPIVFGDGTGIVQVLGSTALTQIESTTSTGPVFDDLIINKTSGNVQLVNASSTINTSLALTNGYIDLNDQKLIVNNTSPSVITRTNGYVLSGNTNANSSIQWNVGTAVGTMIFPFGKLDGTYVPVTMSLVSGDLGNLNVYTYSTTTGNAPWPTAVSTMNSGLFNGDPSVDHVVDRFWRTSITGAGGISAQTFTYADNEIPLSGEALLFAQVWKAGEWQYGIGTVNPLTNTVSTVGVSDYGNWVLVNPNYFLPVHLISFEGEKSDATNLLKWEISGEEELAHYNVERSTDGINFETFEKIESTNANKYYATDNTPFMGATYYRLAMIGNESNVAYSNVVKINSELKFSLYPNPSNGNEIFMHWESESKDVLVVLQDVMGRVIYEKLVLDINYAGDVNLLSGFSKLDAGIYMVLASSSNELIKKKVIVK